MATDAIEITHTFLQAHFRAKGAAAFNKGEDRDSHGFNPGSAAIHEFLVGYDTAKANSTPANGGRVEMAQAHPQQGA